MKRKYDLDNGTDIHDLINASPREVARAISDGDLKPRYLGDPETAAAEQMLKSRVQNIRGVEMSKDIRNINRYYTGLLDDIAVIRASTKLSKKYKPQLFKEYRINDLVEFITRLKALAETGDWRAFDQIKELGRFENYNPGKAKTETDAPPEPAADDERPPPNSRT